jgi:hypothetical protein
MNAVDCSIFDGLKVPFLFAPFLIFIETDGKIIGSSQSAAKSSFPINDKKNYIMFCY